MSNHKQSSVEFYRTELRALVSMKKSKFQTEDEIFQQAKQMHKEELISFAKRCLDKALDLDVRAAHSQVEEMYNETFGGKSFQSSETSNQIDRTITATNGGSNE